MSYLSFRVPTNGYVPKWCNKRIEAGDILSGRVYQNGRVHVWPLKNDQIVFGIALRKKDKKRMVPFENVLAASPLEKYSVPIPPRK